MKNDIGYPYLARKYEELTTKYGILEWKGSANKLEEKFKTTLRSKLKLARERKEKHDAPFAVRLAVILHCNRASEYERLLIEYGILISLVNKDKKPELVNHSAHKEYMDMLEARLKTEESLV